MPVFLNSAKYSIGSANGLTSGLPCCGRLTASTGVPITTTDVTSSSTIYFTPYKGNHIALYDGGQWASYTFSELSRSISGMVTGPSSFTGNISSGSPTVSSTSITTTTTLYVGMPIAGTGIQAGTVITALPSGSSITMSLNATATTTGVALTARYANYDMFAYQSGGTVTMDQEGWTGQTTRGGTGLTLQDGVLVKAGQTNRRYLGTVRVTSDSTIADTVLRRFVWNMYNRVPRTLQARDTAGSWTANLGSTWRQMNANTANKVETITGLVEESYHELYLGSLASSGSGVAGAQGICLDATNSASAWGYTTNQSGVITGRTVYIGGPGSLGYHIYNMVEFTSGGTVTFYGGSTDGEAAFLRGYMMG